MCFPCGSEQRFLPGSFFVFCCSKTAKYGESFLVLLSLAASWSPVCLALLNSILLASYAVLHSFKDRFAEDQKAYKLMI